MAGRGGQQNAFSTNAFRGYGEFYSDEVEVSRWLHGEAEVIWTTTAPPGAPITATSGAGGDFNATTNVITSASHGMVTGVKISGITTTSTLPTGIDLLTAYWPIVLTVDTFQLATSAANAAAGVAVDFTDVGVSGTVTFSFATLGGTVVVERQSFDGTWTALASATSFTTTPLTLRNKDANVTGKNWRFHFNVTGGVITKTTATMEGRE